MILWNQAKVKRIIETTDVTQIVEIEQNEGDEQKVSKAIHYLQYFPPLAIGDLVILNKTATQLKLGTGGYDFVAFSLRFFEEQENQIKDIDLGHIMKLRYTPFQFSVLSSEEENSFYHELFNKDLDLEKAPVLVGELHSMLPILVTVFRQLEKKQLEQDQLVKEQQGTLKQKVKKNIVYIMTDGAALPITLSKHVAKLKELDWLNHTITIGHAYGGDLEAVNIYTGLIAAKHVFKADMIIVLMGPGIVGTGTKWGHTGVEQGEIINAVSILNGVPVSIVRASDADQRGRHYGISHHTELNLKKISLRTSIVPYPKNIDRNSDLFEKLFEMTKGKHELAEVNLNHETIHELLNQYPIPITTMGRSIKDDPLFFDFIASAATWAFEYLIND